MRLALSPEQIQDLIEVYAVASDFKADVVIIGAVALACFIDAIGRHTYDVDLVIALDLDDFQKLVTVLGTVGWRRDPTHEHRWHSPRGSRIDLLPAGPALRAAGRVVCPESQFEMNLAGFDHVFERSVSFDGAQDVRFAVAPPAVIALLKIVAHLDDPQRRSRDLADLKMLFGKYEAQTDRIFDDEVFDADLEDIEFASAFLLGLDVGKMATSEERHVVDRFLNRYRSPELGGLDPHDDQEELRFRLQLKAFEKGLEAS